MDAPTHARVPLPRALLFDMDGTLTRPMLDFPRIKSEMGIGDQPILEALANMEGRRRAEAEAVLLRHEEHAAEHSALNDGCLELLHWARESGIRSALVTRNSRLSMETVLAKHRLSLEVLVTREDPPPKPNPHPLYLACKRLGVLTSDAWMIGDGWHDIEAGRAAGINTVWLSHGRERPFEAEPWREVRDLPELLRLLQDLREACDALNERRPDRDIA